MKTPIILAGWLLLLCSCKKEASLPNLSSPDYKEYIIPKGQHYTSNNNLKEIEVSELRFIARFDSSAIYTSISPENQYDINKLYGFSDNGQPHHLFSARFGWRWSDGMLHLFGYTYNNGVREEKELGIIDIGVEVYCSIKAVGSMYQFSLGDKKISMPRLSTTSVAKGYQLYPYFGGDEAAPHDVHIWIKELK